MNKTEYYALIEDIANESDITLSDILLNKISVHAVTLENIFSMDDIYEELKDLFPKRVQEQENFEYFLDEVTNLIFENADSSSYDDESNEEDE